MWNFILSIVRRSLMAKDLEVECQNCQGYDSVTAEDIAYNTGSCGQCNDVPTTSDHRALLAAMFARIQELEERLGLD